MSSRLDYSPSIYNDLSGRSLFKRCIKCDESAPQCPACEEGYTCTMTSQSCNACASTSCVKIPGSSSSQSSSSDGGSDSGPIAGGVIGGLAFVAIVTFLIWWFFIRKKRKELAQQEASEEKSSTFAEARDARKSTHSIASTVLTRASNVIQIAYIPGVTNRSPPETPGMLVPPVPPLPGAHPDQHFFMPGDLRDSSWSDMSEAERRSIAPSLRSSVATTIYRNNAIVSPMPAQQAMRSRAAVVSIHTGGNASNARAVEAPAVPAITKAQLAKAHATEVGPSSIVARTAVAKPVTVTRPVKKNNVPNSGAGAPTVQTIQEQAESGTSTTASRSESRQFDHNQSTFDNISDDEDNTVHSRPSKTTTPSTNTSSKESDSSNASQSPFKDQLSTEEDSASASNGRSLLAEMPARGESPFSDANEVK